MEQQAFIKFPTSNLKGTDTIIGASLRLKKLGGPAGTVVVKLSACSFTRNTLTYTSSKKLVEDSTKAASASFPAEKDVSVSIKLDSAQIQAARSSGNHICLQVTGGPKEEPVIFASELTSTKPELKVEIQKAPPSKAALAKKAAEKKKEQEDLKKAAAVEAGFRKKREKEFTAASLGKKAEKVKKVIALKKKEAEEEATKASSGDVFKVLQAAAKAKQDKDDAKAIEDKSAIIKTEAESKMTKAITASGLTGSARSDLEKKMKAETATTVSANIANMRKEVLAAGLKTVVDAVKKKIEDKKAEIAKKLAAVIDGATAGAGVLTDAEKKTVKGQVDAKVAKDVAEYKSSKVTGVPMGKKKPPKADPKKVKAPSAAEEKAKAAKNHDVQKEVDGRLAKALNEAVAGKMGGAVASALQGLKNKFTKESDAARDAKIKTESKNKTTDEKKKIKDTVTAASAEELKTKITEASTGEKLKAIKSGLKAKLEAELKPAVEAKLTADAKNAAAKNAGKKKGGAAMLDLADSFQPTVVELEY